MPKFSRLLLLVVFVFAPAFARSAQPVKNIGEVVVRGDHAIGVRITASSPDLQQVADKAFQSHGGYERMGKGYSYDIKFTAINATQVKVDVTRGATATPFLSQTVAGTSARNALLRAADIVVEKTNRGGLRGFFTAQITYILQQGGNKGDIYTSDLFFGEAKRWTHENALNLTPRWSPDGSRIIFTSYFKTGAPDIFTIDTRTGRRDTFVSFRGTNMGARFSPTGQQVAMICGEGAPEIYVSNAQGRQVRPLTRSGTSKSSPTWSPDGTRLLFSMGEPLPQLYVMSAAGGAPQRVVTKYAYTAEPDWNVTSPNKIACTIREGGRFQIAVYDFSAPGAAKVVSKASFDGVEPVWLADGRHLVYTARDRTTSVLCILDTETGRSTPVSPSRTQAVQASVWTPAR